MHSTKNWMRGGIRTAGMRTTVIFTSTVRLRPPDHWRSTKVSLIQDKLTIPAGDRVKGASQAAAERTLASIQNWIEKHLRLKVNEAKSGTGRVGHRHSGRVNLSSLTAPFMGASATRLTFVLRPWSGTKVPGLSTEP